MGQSKHQFYYRDTWNGDMSCIHSQNRHSTAPVPWHYSKHLELTRPLAGALKMCFGSVGAREKEKEGRDWIQIFYPQE